VTRYHQGMRAVGSGIVLLLPWWGCWTNNPPPPPQGVRNVAPATTPAVGPLASHTSWRGRYECAQGVTALQLTLDVDPNGRAAAIFDFGPLADNPSIPAGSYRMTGSATPTDDAITVTLEPEAWISQPDDYMMVGIQAGIDASRRGMRGRITHASCGWIDLKRID
jgi:hypothetical protein